MSKLRLKRKQERDLRVAAKTGAVRTASTPGGQPVLGGQTAVNFNNPSPAHIHHLQRTVGNQAVRRLVVQRKMTLGPVGDKYEQEADAVAKQVVGKLQSPQLKTDAPETAQRQEEDDELQMKPISSIQRQEEDDEDVQMKPSSTMGGGDISSDVEGQIQSAKGSGRPLSPHVQSSMSQAFNADFSGVKVHTNNQADTLNRSLQARAFTTGQDIFFRSGEYNPNSGGGQELLAHELTHVVQQNGRGNVQRQMGETAVSVNQTAPNHLLSLKRRKMYLDFIRVKKKDTHIAKMMLSKIGLAKNPDDAYGHWWIEIGDKTGGASQKVGTWTPVESFGWWPSKGVNIKETFMGVPGQLNRGEGKDPHHGDDAKIEYHPVKTVDDNDSYESIRDEVLNDVHQFARGFKGSWNWRFGWGKNCHTFLDRLKKQTKLHHQKGSRWLLRPDNTQSTAGMMEGQAEEQRNANVLNIITNSGFADLGDGTLEYFDTTLLTSDLNLGLDDYRNLNEETQTGILEYLGVSAEGMNTYMGYAFGEEGGNLFS